MTVICYGDSNTYGYDPRSFLGGRFDTPWPEGLAELTGWKVVNRGSCGQRIPIHPPELWPDADLILVMLGTNDLLSGDMPDLIGTRMAQFLSELPLEKLLLLAPPGLNRGEWVCDDDLIRRSRDLAGEYRKVANRLGIRFLDTGEWGLALCFDGVHLTEAAHDQFARKLTHILSSETGQGSTAH